MKKLLFTIALIATVYSTLAGMVQDVVQPEEVTMTVVGTAHYVDEEDFIFEIDNQLYHVSWETPEEVEIGEQYAITFCENTLISLDRVQKQRACVDVQERDLEGKTFTQALTIYYY